MQIDKEVVKEKSIRGGVILLMTFLMIGLGFIVAGTGWVIEKISKIFENPDKFINTAFPIFLATLLFAILIGFNALKRKSG